MAAGGTLHFSNHKTGIPVRQADRGSDFVGNQLLVASSTTTFNATRCLTGTRLKISLANIE
ncbi:hypothetical protein CA85_32730 [Allorhodopirellula solitaria]|uniref:Uncharacterized protein n=1 Tax=Allorhodopirellula solitaria TaxID=2527987 RepID=A0A5C5XS65_9BACT|nr:hypothetical protein CA85_32730 [Allorhodopirellula solitaria]